MDAIENNVREINSLNQRGGRMLSIVDLIDDGTVDPPTAGYLLACVGAGASFLTAAGPGGVGKTTLMACLLSFLPPGERIATVTDPATVPDPSEPTCYLCHEIGSGHWYGYLWGDDAARFLALRDRGRIAGSLHADTDREIRDQLLGPSVGAAEKDLAAIDLLLTMVRVGGRRRISTIYEATASERAEWETVVEWNRSSDDFAAEQSRYLPREVGGDEAEARVAAGIDFIRDLVADDVRMLEDVVDAVAEFYSRERDR